MKKILSLLVLLALISLVSCTTDNDTDPIPDDDDIPALTEDEQFVKDILSGLSLEEKVGQMLQAERASITPQEVSTYNIGSILSGGGSHPFAYDDGPDVWYDMVRTFQEAAISSSSGIPLLYGVDAVHGHNNVHGATIFPHNINLGMTGDPDLVRRVGEATAREVRATGIHWNFSPAVSVAEDIRWGRTYESFSENNEVHDILVKAYVEGLQSDGVIATAKHFIADGGTMGGTDQGDVTSGEAHIRDVHLPPYVKAIEGGVESVMVSFSSIGGVKMHASAYWITDVLKDDLGFEGIVISDWNATFQIPGDFRTQLSTSINAGIDMLMLPYDWKNAHTEIVQAVGAGLIDETRIDDAVSRILSVKVRNGLYDDPYGRLDPLMSFGTDVHRTLAREAAAASYVLLKDDGVFPLSPSDDIHVTGPAADHVGYLAGGWTTYWQGNDNAVIGTGMSIQDALEVRLDGHQGKLVSTTESSDTVIVVFTEVPYAEGAGDTGNPSIFGDKAHPGNQAAYETALEAKAEGKTVIGVLASGRPLILEDTLEVFDAFVAIFLPGSEGGPALADVMYGDVSFNGTLSFTWPATLGYFTQGRNPETVLFPFGHGLLEDNGNG